MTWVETAVDFVLHIDQYLAGMIDNHGDWVYLFFFLIVFCETGLVFTPFLPGDSLIFASATFAATGHLDLETLIMVYLSAAILGDFTNYHIGRFFGPWILSKKWQFISKKHIDSTKDFYEDHGPKAIIIGRFLPVFRTFVPFFAGIGKMKRKKFISYSILGTALWVLPSSLGGYYFGNHPFVRANFSFVILGIVVITLLPIFISLLLEKRNKSKDNKFKTI